MMQWCRLHLSNGVLDGDTLLSGCPNELPAQRTNDYLPNRQQNKHILSVLVCRTKQPVPCLVSHGKHLGIYSPLYFCSRAEPGMMWLGNSEPPAEPRYAIMRHIIDYYMNLPTQDYSTADLEIYLRRCCSAGRKRKQEQAAMVPEPAAPYSQYVGAYTHPALGEAVITLKKANCTLPWGGRFPWRKHKMTHVNGQQFRFRSGGTAFTLTFYGRLPVGI